ncbi:MAG TPA: DNA repair protein RecN [Leptospiraceae bacterium]|nr:DNA repair protein RecN [Leptospiraceae bacterium]HMY68577.1 DNA repair protein RecN [Leptospiraceae bacterium]HNM05433.1 DNA repair protein RecN [Leptospiraceae bacterium]HNN06839.1 DNA repair protein RecN [Leptospiraceae bacterium]
MLNQLKIRDFALIENLDLDFRKGMTSLTGESGSGKSLIFDAICTVLGAKCNTLNIRSGAKRYQIEAEFSLKDLPAAAAYLEDRGIEAEDGKLVLRKELNQEGKSRIQVNDALVPAQFLKELGSLLAEIHRQNEQISILERTKQLEILDTFAANQDLKKQYQKSYTVYRTLKNRLIELETQKEDREKKKEIYEYQIQEIANAKLREDEEDKLIEEEKILIRSEKILQYLSGMAEELNGSEESALRHFTKILHHSERLGSIDPVYQPLTQDVQDIYYKLRDLLTLINDNEEEIQFSLERMETVQNRLDQISRLKKKYGGKSVSELIQYAKTIENELEIFQSGMENLGNLKEELEKEKKKLCDVSIKLSQSRRSVIPMIESAISHELESLGMKDAKLQVIMRWETAPEGDVEEGGKKYYLTDSGLDQVDFYFSANIGEKPRPLRKIASGGEISRLMLALKTALNCTEKGKLILFDEIDSGISGEVAFKVAQKLKKISETEQLLLITHQQCIAAASTEQIHVEKVSKDQRTQTVAKKVNGEKRIRELAKMISGENVTSSALEHAKELLKKEAV